MCSWTDTADPKRRPAAVFSRTLRDTGALSWKSGTLLVIRCTAPAFRVPVLSSGALASRFRVPESKKWATVPPNQSPPSRSTPWMSSVIVVSCDHEVPDLEETQSAHSDPTAPGSARAARPPKQAGRPDQLFQCASRSLKGASDKPRWLSIRQLPPREFHQTTLCNHAYKPQSFHHPSARVLRFE